MSASTATLGDRQPLPWRQRLWPVAPLLLIAAGVSGLIGDPLESSAPELVLFAALPVVLAIAVTGLVIGGRRGRKVAIGLTVLAVWWVFWFGWLIEDYSAGITVWQVSSGLAYGAMFEVELLINLWPLVLAAAMLVGVTARRRGRPVWTAVGALALALVVLSFPFGARWSDGCNDHSGAAPLLTFPVTQLLMDHGIGVQPDGSMTLRGCRDIVSDGEWKPFWRGGDDIPPRRQLYVLVSPQISVPDKLAPR